MLRAKGEVRQITPDPVRNRLVVGSGEGPVSFIHLLHARPEWDRAPVGSRHRVLHRRFWSSIRGNGAGAELVLGSVLPRIRDRAWFSAVRRQAELELGADESAIDEVMLPHVTINDELAAHLAYELPSSVTEIGADRIAAWGHTFEALMERAKQNLLKLSALPFEEPSPGIFVSPYHDTLDASRMLLPELYKGLKVKGRPVVIAPTHDIVFCTGEDDEAGLQQLGTWTEEALLEPRAHSAICFVLDKDDKWAPWLPPKGHPAYAKLKLLALQTTASAYSRQKEILEALLESNGHEILVATLRAFRSASGDVFTACAWQDGLEALLPQTDRIDFVRPGPENTATGAKVWSTTFDVARRTLGELMQPIGDLPERWRVKGFPTEAQLEQMATEGKL
ncbi:MAG: hypothetical protein U0228_21875 [Myxococcaceae bacterium]